MAKKEEKKQWFKLDNSGKLYPAVRNTRWSANFRLSVLLTEEIDPVLLQQALECAARRFVNFRLRLKKGLFWYYLEEGTAIAQVELDAQNPCRRFGKGKKDQCLYRVCYYQKRIALEVFHVLSDASGAMVFLKTIVAQYLQQKYGISIPCLYGVADCSEKPDAQEMEDAFQRYARFHAFKQRKESSAYHFQGTQLPYGEISIITGQIPVDRLVEKTRQYKVTMTEFLAGVMIYALSQCQQHSDCRVELPVKVSIPINLRNYYPSKTVRNFSLYVNPGIEPRYGEFTFEEILEDVHHFMRMNVKEKYLNAMMCTNLSSERNPLLRSTPLFLKNVALSTAFRLYGDRLYSSTLSNLGVTKLPKEMERFVERFDFMLGRFNCDMPSAACVTYRNTLVFNWTSGLKEKEVERRFFTTLVQLGVPVKIESNLR